MGDREKKERDVWNGMIMMHHALTSSVLALTTLISLLNTRHDALIFLFPFCKVAIDVQRMRRGKRRDGRGEKSCGKMKNEFYSNFILLSIPTREYCAVAYAF